MSEFKNRFFYYTYRYINIFDRFLSTNLIKYEDSRLYKRLDEFRDDLRRSFFNQFNVDISNLDHEYSSVSLPNSSRFLVDQTFEVFYNLDSDSSYDEWSEQAALILLDLKLVNLENDKFAITYVSPFETYTPTSYPCSDWN